LPLTTPDDAFSTPFKFPTIKEDVVVVDIFKDLDQDKLLPVDCRTIPAVLPTANLVQSEPLKYKRSPAVWPSTFNAVDSIDWPLNTVLPLKYTVLLKVCVPVHVGEKDVSKSNEPELVMGALFGKSVLIPKIPLTLKPNSPNCVFLGGTIKNVGIIFYYFSFEISFNYFNFTANKRQNLRRALVFIKGATKVKFNQNF
jgi:hypothetical protein